MNKGAVRRVLQQTPYTPETQIADIRASGRLTVVLFVVYAGKVLFVKPSKGKHCILPQGGVSLSRDETLRHAAEREGEEELGLQRTCFAKDKSIFVLGEAINPLPPERESVVSEGMKHLIVLAIPVWYSDWVRLNGENKKFIWVDGQNVFLSLIRRMHDERPEKFWLTVNAVDDMGKRGVIPWSSGLGTAL